MKSMLKKEIAKMLPQGAKIFFSKFADYSTNIALTQKINAEKLAKKLAKNKIFSRVEIKNGFINFFLSQDYLRKNFKKIQAPKLGQQKVMVEFISANPTGPLHIGNGRGAFWGDALANVLSKTGQQVTREYYINDSGRQIQDLKRGVYQGETRDYKAIQEANENFIQKKLKINFDNFFSEQSLYASGAVEKILALLKKKNLLYNRDGAFWFKSSSLGDDKDRVLLRKDGSGTYILGDIAYHDNKFNERKFAKVINIWGADHHGDVARLQAGVKALGHPGKLYIILMQLVRLIRDGKEQKMSKRAGIYVTLEELINEVCQAAARFFFLSYSPDTHMDFDINLARERSEKNPAYYVQYAHARMQGILRKVVESSETNKTVFKEADYALIKQLFRYPEVLEEVARNFEVHKLANYSLDLSRSFHNFYHHCPVIGAGKERLALLKKTQAILKETLDIMGIEAPEKM